MKVDTRIIMRVVPLAIPVLTIAIFILDLLTPVGLAVSVLYVIPLMMTFLSSRERDSLYFCVIATGLLWANLFLKPAALLMQYGALNRALGMFVLWFMAVGLLQYKRIRSHLATVETGKSQALQELMSERVRRSQAEGLLTAAQEARAYSETAAMGALASRRAAEEQYLITRLRLEGIIQSAMDAIITVDEGQRILIFNDAAERMFKRPAREMISQPLDKLIPRRFCEAHQEHIQRFGESGVTNRKMGGLGTVMGLRADGEEFPVEAAISTITVEGKKFYTVILRDITDRNQAERLIRQSEERYRQLIAVSPLAIVVYRGDRVIFINDAGLKLFGAVKAEEILGKSRFDLFHPDCHDLIRDRVQQLMKGNTTVPIVGEKIVTLDGRVVDVEVSKARFTDEEGPAIVAMIRDVSERNRLQEQLRRTERIAELGMLASGMAHEIGTPMNVILGRAEYLMQRTREEPLKKGLQTIVSQVERITKVMNQLLAFARRKPVERRALDLQKTVDDNLEIFEERLARHRITIERVFAESCPPVFGDADQMSQVVINLVMNALHAMSDGGTLRVRVSPHGEMVRLTVADTGQGIPEDVVAKVFDPFFTTKEFGKGTGLGLTVVKGIIEEHHGTITVESEPGKGTTFTIHLPMYRAGL